jgi:hypothetical protein
MALQGAGFKGPFWPRTRTYSQTCLATIGVAGHAATTVASNVGLKKYGPGVVGWLGRLFGGAAEDVAAASQSLARYFGGPEITAIMAPAAIDELLEKCECKDGN